MQIAKKHSMTVLSLAVSDDHIHMVVSMHPTMSPSKALQFLKGASSWALFRIFPNFRMRYPHGALWGRNGTFRSVGDVDKQTVIEYSDSHNQLPLTDFFISQEFCGF